VRASGGGGLNTASFLRCCSTAFSLCISSRRRGGDVGGDFTTTQDDGVGDSGGVYAASCARFATILGDTGIGCCSGCHVGDGGGGGGL